MAKTVVALYTGLESIHAAVIHSIDADFPPADISLVIHDSNLIYRLWLFDKQELDDLPNNGVETESNPAFIQDIKDKVVGLSALDLPEVGAVILAGPLAASVTLLPNSPLYR